MQYFSIPNAFFQERRVDMKKLIMVLFPIALMIAFGTSAPAAPIASVYSNLLDSVSPGLEDKVPEGYIPPGLQKKLPTPFVRLTVEGLSYDDQMETPMFLPNGKILFKKKKIKGGPNKNKPDYVVELQMLGKIDPFISYTFSAINYTENPLLFSTTGAIFMDPVVSGPNAVFASLGASVTDMEGNGASIASSDGTTPLQTAFVGDGTNWTNMGVDVGGEFNVGAGGTTYSYGPSEANGSGPVGDWTELSYNLDFILSPLDSVAFTGYVSIDPVIEPVSAPIPLTVFLLGSGLISLLLIRRRSGNIS
jgi:hypothetical protein